MIEAWWRSLKHQNGSSSTPWDSAATVRRLVAFYVGPAQRGAAALGVSRTDA